MNYEEENDFMLNMMMFKYSEHYDPDKEIFYEDNNGFEWVMDKYSFSFDPCNNPTDNYPFLQEMLLSEGFMLKSTHGFSGWRVLYKNTSCTDENFMRATVICYLKYKDMFNENN